MAWKVANSRSVFKSWSAGYRDDRDDGDDCNDGDDSNDGDDGNDGDDSNYGDDGNDVDIQGGDD